jgi:peptidoglycan hydrolase-like protein with peptidoglycan-binding domain
MRTKRLGKDPQLQIVASGALLLSLGKQGSGVMQIQDILASVGFNLPKSMSRRGADGIFGAETEQVVKEFQKSRGLKADGIVGPKTLDALEQVIIEKPFLEAPDPAQETALNFFDASAPKNLKRSVYL